jgi:hypothetical protein
MSTAALYMIRAHKRRPSVQLRHLVNSGHCHDYCRHIHPGIACLFQASRQHGSLELPQLYHPKQVEVDRDWKHPFQPLEQRKHTCKS